MVRLNSHEYDENKGASSSSLRLNDVDTKDLKSLTNQELWDLVMQFADYTEKWGSDVNMEKLNAIREELKRRWDEELKQYWEIRATIKNSHYENREKADALKSLLNENDDIIAKKFPRLTSKDWTKEMTDKNIESNDELKKETLNNMYSLIWDAWREEILKFERSGAAKDRWYEHNEAYATAAIQMIRAYERFVKDNEDQLKKLWLEKDINKLYKIAQAIRYRYPTWEWITKYEEMRDAFAWIRKYLENLEDGKATRPEFKDGFINEDLYNEYITKHGWDNVRHEKLI